MELHGIETGPPSEGRQTHAAPFHAHLGLFVAARLLQMSHDVWFFFEWRAAFISARQP